MGFQVAHRVSFVGCLRQYADRVDPAGDWVDWDVSADQAAE